MMPFYWLRTDDIIRLSFIADVHERNLGVRPTERELIHASIQHYYTATCSIIKSQLSGGDE